MHYNQIIIAIVALSAFCLCCDVIVEYAAPELSKLWAEEKTVVNFGHDYGDESYQTFVWASKALYHDFRMVLAHMLKVIALVEGTTLALWGAWFWLWVVWMFTLYWGIFVLGLGLLAMRAITWLRLPITLCLFFWFAPWALSPMLGADAMYVEEMPQPMYLEVTTPNFLQLYFSWLQYRILRYPVYVVVLLALYAILGARARKGLAILTRLFEDMRALYWYLYYWRYGSPLTQLLADINDPVNHSAVLLALREDIDKAEYEDALAAWEEHAAIVRLEEDDPNTLRVPVECGPKPILVRRPRNPGESERRLLLEARTHFHKAEHTRANELSVAMWLTNKAMEDPSKGGYGWHPQELNARLDALVTAVFLISSAQSDMEHAVASRYYNAEVRRGRG